MLGMAAAIGWTVSIYWQDKLENDFVTLFTLPSLMHYGLAWWNEGAEEDEIFMTELLRELGFLAPRTEIVNVKIN